MKKFLIAIAAMVSISFSMGLEITPFGGFQWNGSNEFSWPEGTAGRWYTGTFDMDHYGNYGLFVNIDMPARGTELELMWTGCASKGHWRSNSPTYKSKSFDMYSNYWHIGTLKAIGDPNGMVSPFINTSVGATRLSAKDDYINDEWFFSVSAGLGAKININDKIGIRFGGRFLVPVNFSGVGLSFGSGGSSVGAYGNVPLLQGDVHGGLIIKLGGGKKQAVTPTQKSVAPQQQEPAQTQRIEEVSPTEVHIINE